MHSRCQEDTSGTAHLGVAVLPVVLVLAEAGLARPDDLLPAVVAGYEIGGAMERAMGKQTMAAGFRASAIYGIFAAAAASARALALPEAGVHAALSAAASFAGGNLQSIAEGTDEWRYQAGVAAKLGLYSAMLARAGAVTARHGIEGSHGFCATIAGIPAGESSWAQALGSDWSLPAVTFKPYPVCAHNQAVVELAVDIGQAVAPDDVAALRLYINPYVVPGMLTRGPHTRVSETLLSTYFCVATGVCRKSVTLKDLARFDDPGVHALIAKTSIELSDSFAFPAVGALVDTTDGRSLRFSKPRVFEDYSFSRDEVTNQLSRLAAEAAVPQAAMDALVGAVGNAQWSVADVVDAYRIARQAAGRRT